MFDKLYNLQVHHKIYKDIHIWASTPKYCTSSYRIAHIYLVQFDLPCSCTVLWSVKQVFFVADRKEVSIFNYKTFDNLKPTVPTLTRLPSLFFIVYFDKREVSGWISDSHFFGSFIVLFIFFRKAKTQTIF